MMRKYSPLCFLVLAGCSQTPQSSSLPEPYIIFAERDGYTLYESYQLVESQVQRLSSEGGELQLKEVKQVDPVPDGRLYLKDPEGKVKLLTTHENFGPSFFAEGGAFSADMQTVYTVAVKNQSQEGIYAIDLKTLNASLVLSSSEMGFELIDGTTLEASRSGELGFKAYQVQEVPVAREGNPEGTPFELTDQFYLLDLDGERTKKAIPLGPSPGAGLEPEYRFVSPTTRHDQLIGMLLEMPYRGEADEVKVDCGFNCNLHIDKFQDKYALDFNGLAGGDSDLGDPVFAAYAGSVYKTVKNPGGEGYGNRIILKHSRNLWTLYAHLNSCNSSVLPQPPKPEYPVPTCGTQPSQNAPAITVHSGSPIGTVGKTGLACTDCAHLHFVVRQGVNGNWEGSDSTPPVPMSGVGPYKDKGKPVLPIFPRGEPGEQDDLVVYPYGPVPALNDRQERTTIPCTPIVDFFTDDASDYGKDTARYYMTVSKFYDMWLPKCGIYDLVKDRKNYPPYPPELAQQFGIPDAWNKPGYWIEHQQACRVEAYAGVTDSPLILVPTDHCTGNGAE